jgi:class 3 adenylate cyclase
VKKHINRLVLYHSLTLSTFFIFLSLTFLKAGENTDSLESLFDLQEVGIEKIELGIKLADLKGYVEPLETIKFGSEVLEIIEEGKRSGRYPDTLIIKWEKTLLGDLATAYNYVGDHEMQVEYLVKLLDLADKTADRNYQRSALANLGVALQDQGNKREAIAYYRKALKISEEDQHTYGMSMALGNIGTAIGDSNPDSTLYYYKRSLELMKRKDMMDQGGAMGWMMNNIGSWYKRAGNVDSAFHYYFKSLAIRDSIDHRLGLVIINRDLAELFFEVDNKAQALRYINSSIELGEKNHFTDVLSSSYRFRSELYEEIGRFQESLSDHKKYLALRDSATNEKNLKRVLQQSMRYEYGRKQLADSLNHAKEFEVQALDNQLAQEKLKRTRNIYLFGGLGILFLTGGLWSRLRYVRRSRAIIRREKEISENLLLNILPAEVAEELKSNGQAEAQMIEQVTVLFTDFKDFTSISETMSPKELVHDIHEYFSAFDQIIEKYKVEKIKTIGDAYMAAGGLPVPNDTHAADVIHVALEIRDFVSKRNEERRNNGEPFFEIRIGIHTGPVVAGIVGVKKFSYDIWGDTVNTASRMESSGESGKINVSDTTYLLLKDHPNFKFESRGITEVKGKGALGMWFVEAV